MPRPEDTSDLHDLDPERIVITNQSDAPSIPENASRADLIGSMAGKIKITGDPMSTGIPWHAES